MIVGPTRSPLLRCRLFGCRLTSTPAVVRARIWGGGPKTWSELQTVTLCVRCRQITTHIEIPVEDGDALEWVRVELEDVRSEG